jgi:putative endonuclease
MNREFQPAVYLLASRRNGTLYTGVTSDLAGRTHKHRTGQFSGFTREYGVKMLVWFELHATMEQATVREKRIKKWNRTWKLELIEAANPNWRDLAEDLGFEPLVLIPLGSRFRGNDEREVDARSSPDIRV